METLENYVAGLFNITPDLLFTPTRKREVVDARKVCVSAMRDFTQATTNQIGNHFNLNHSTVSYLVGKASMYYRNEPEFKSIMDDVYDRCDARDLDIHFSYSDDLQPQPIWEADKPKPYWEEELVLMQLA